MIDLSMDYLGLQLKNPIVIASSPLGEKIETVVELEKKGMAAIVLPSLFEEQVEIEEKSHFLLYEKKGYQKYLDYYQEALKNKLTPEKYMKYISDLKKKIKVPVIGSLNGVSVGGWINNAISMEEAGADAIELNIYFLPTNPEMDGRQVEENYLKLVDEVTSSVGIPVAVKIHPYLSSIPNMGKSLVEAGASALVLFNRFYQPDIDLEIMSVEPVLKLSSSDELLLRIRWIAILFKKINTDFAITGGVHTAEDVIKSIMVGANAAMLTSSLLEKGIDYLDTMLENIEKWLDKHNFNSLQQIQGVMSQKAVAEPAVFERANYLKVLDAFKK
ncbi:MAG: dihydroorotate dehydrogenase-like protein [Atribacterota bacterium]|nr:dihydroorotate dehydrogenase-like protein [Atribacterota bacterium]